MEHDVPFEIVGASWGFREPDAAQVKRLWAAHIRKCEAKGIRPRPHRAKPAELATAS